MNNRETLFITTKVSPENLRYNDVIASAKESLKRLKTEYIDLYLIHVPNLRIPIQKTMEALNFLYKQELIKFIGVSNFSVEQIKEAQRSGQNKIVANHTIPKSTSIEHLKENLGAVDWKLKPEDIRKLDKEFK